MGKIKLSNHTDLPSVRFRGVHFDPAYQFSRDVAAGAIATVDNVPSGSIGLTAYRASDQVSLDMLSYPVSDETGFAAVLIHDPEDEFQPYKLVGEPFQIP